MHFDSGGNCSNHGSGGIPCVDRLNIGTKLIMLRLYISLMRGNVEKCHEIIRHHCNLEHVAVRQISEKSPTGQVASSSILSTSVSARNTKMVTAGGESKV